MRKERKKYLVAFARALVNYLKANGLRIISISKLTGQKYVLISFRGLFRYHDPFTGYVKFMDAWDEAVSDGFLEVLKRKNIELIKNEELYLKFPLDLLEKIIDLDEEKLIKFILS